MFIDFRLPERLIAMHPSQQRDRCKMLVFDRATKKIQHAGFHELPTFLSSDYFMVLNQARVEPSRIFWTDSKNKRQEMVFLKNLTDADQSSTWEAIVSGKKLKTDQSYALHKEFSFKLMKPRENSIAHISVNQNKTAVQQMLEKAGQLPLPPYILTKRRETGTPEYTDQDRGNYQTVFAKQGGAIASPTAGLHFTDGTFKDLEKSHIDWDFVHLSVGWGTFAPLSQQHFDLKKLHSEFCSVSKNVAERICSAKESGKKILAVGTTVARTLESWARSGKSRSGFEADTELFIVPPYDFQMTDALLTNFHIPKSSLLLLVAAFLGDQGEKTIVDLYEQAIAKEYMFYSYGDCMLIL